MKHKTVIALIVGFVLASLLFLTVGATSKKTMPAPVIEYEFQACPNVNNEFILFRVNKKNGEIEAVRIDTRDHGDRFEWDGKWRKLELE